MEATAPARANAPAEGASETLDEIETRLLLEGIYARYGFDFRNYAPASIRRRLEKRRLEEGLANLSSLQEKILHDPDSMERLLRDLSVHVTSMFRDPDFYRSFRARVVPLLATYPFIRIWHAGCSSGEEVYSIAILLEEEGLYERARIYATDMSEAVVREAQAGIFPLPEMKEYTANYLRAGGRASFSDYYIARYENAIFRADLRRNIVFSRHNLATDGSFNEFNAVLCRNVVIYFNSTLRDAVLRLFQESLCRFGILALGSKESLQFTAVEKDFEAVDPQQKIYRRIR